MANFPGLPLRLFDLVDLNIFNKLEDTETEKLAAILNENQFPEKFRRKSELQSALDGKFDKAKILGILDFVGSFINFVLRMADSYDEVTEIFNEVVEGGNSDENSQRKAKTFFSLLVYRVRIRL